MDWQYAAPGIALLLVKLTGTSLFFAFLPQIFPRGNFSSAQEENFTVLPTTKSPADDRRTNPGRAANTISDSPFRKPPRWERFRGSDYWFSEDVDAWTNSQFNCQDFESDLLIINDQKELEFIRNKTTTADYFLGLTYSEDKNRWEWIDGQRLIKSLVTMRANVMGKDCATIRAGVVSPELCHNPNNWICEKQEG